MVEVAQLGCGWTVRVVSMAVEVDDICVASVRKVGKQTSRRAHIGYA